ncbi:putative PH domain-containing protein [Cyphellophora attinorum]|uniref:Putative PH domain-containing protein n=1 Tax=Cyphellophora attinorum TaxID=1664694 RepID=A0A0N1HGG2_9EURO|nr:putative PH domain-containing protein [Phialophora attinorum]KPI44724.1 putative PH domain-containing protein [Phialophora attinorum]
MAEALLPSAEVGRLINLIPVGLKEAAIDSPTARATIVHYGEQVDLLERWLEEYMRVTNRLVAESSTLEGILNSFTSHALVPTTISEAMLDHDYDVLAMKRYSEGAKDYWMSMVSVVKRLSNLVVEPIRMFLQHDLKAFREARRSVDAAQKVFDNQSTRYASLSKTKEPSFLREEAFQLHEARRAYLRASLDFFAIAPQFRFSVDKLLVRIFCDQWKEMRNSRDTTAAIFQRGAGDMDRVKGWLTTMEESEKAFRRELHAARKQLEESAENATRPSREIEDYSTTLGSQYAHGHSTSVASGPRSPRKVGPKTPEKQGWLYLRTYASRPTRTVWVKRWSFLRNGVFGWLLQSSRAGGVEESERIGVLLCSARQAVNEERRFCFEVKTTKHTIVLQAESQNELQDWLSTFETAKSKALEDPASLASLGSPGLSNSDPAFAISNPPIPEFGASILAATEPGAPAEDTVGSLDRSGTLPAPGADYDRAASMDIARRATAADEGGQRDHASRIISKLDLHRKASPSIQSPTGPGTGGIASLIAASHGSINASGTIPMLPSAGDPEKPRAAFALALRDMPPSTLAPSTLANVPAPTNMSKAAVVVTGERGLSGALDKSGLPNSLLANMWGSSNTAYVNRLDRTEARPAPDVIMATQDNAPTTSQDSPTKAESTSHGTVPQLDLGPPAQRRARSQSPAKRNAAGRTEGNSAAQLKSDNTIPDFPNYYPLQLKTQDAQFRLLFPSVRRDERLLLVFRATWSPNDQQDFPGRIYVTPSSIYFYSNHLGLVLTSTVSLSSIDEATAAPGRECDFLFLHMKEGGPEGSTTRITIKTFLEPLRLLQRRINFLVTHSTATQPQSLESLIKALLKMETDVPDRTPSLESWEDVPPDTPADAQGHKRRGRSNTVQSELRAPMRVSTALNPYSTSAYDKAATKFKLPAQPVKYTPPGNLTLAAEREFDVSPKALFHVMFGDRSALWQLLQHEKHARNLKQGPWTEVGEGRLRRDFEYQVTTANLFGRESATTVRDYQIIDVNSDHLCYVVTDKATPWHLPFPNTYRLVSKVVITHVAKAKCKLAIFVKVEWLGEPWALKGMLGRQALHDLELDAADLADLVGDQVRKLETTSLELDKGAAGQSLELRRVGGRRTVGTLLKQGVESGLQSALGMLLASIVSVVQWLGKTIVANKVILAALLFSALWNTWYVQREGWMWWQERRAVRFMGRMGVKPEVVMSKAVYLGDLDELMGEHLNVVAGITDPGDGAAGGANTCYEVFVRDHAGFGEQAELVSVPSSSAPSSAVSRSRSSSAIRTQRTRRELGKYRHDLLVAMRMVNSVEREVVRSEWEDWVEGERRKCGQVGELLEKVRKGKDKKGKKGTVSGNETEIVVEHMGLSGATDAGGELDEWFREYCASCKAEGRKIDGVGGRKLL